MATQAAAPIQNRPVAVRAAKPAAGEQAAPAATEASQRTVDVAKFRLLPGAGQPLVLGDEALKSGLIPRLVSGLAKMGPIGKGAAGAIVLGSTIIGPAVFGLSMWNIGKGAVQVKDDPTYAPASKGVIYGASAVMGVSFLTALGSAIPKIAAGTRLTLNKVSNISGGLAGTAFSAINLIETLRNKDATPVERMFAKLGFGTGMTGFVVGATALIASMTRLGAAAPGLVRALAWIGTGAGVGNMAFGLGQMLLGKNAWLNEKVKGSPLA